MINLFGLSVKSGKVKKEIKETKITGDKTTYYYELKDVNNHEQPLKLPKEFPELDKSDCN